VTACSDRRSASSTRWSRHPCLPWSFAFRRVALLALALLLAGCKSQTAAPPDAARGGGGNVPQATARPNTPDHTGAPLSNTDPCATRLHDICEPLLLYYSVHHQLPARLDELRQLPGFEGDMLNFTCPVSHLPYVYNPIGILTMDDQPRIILYDPQPSHAGARWAVAIIEPQGNAPLVTKVVGLPESRFTLKPPR
jgi:hypothetical protein